MRAILIALVIAGCADPTLSVEVTLPDAYRAQIATVSIADYESSALDCDAIAFGDVSAQTLEGALATEVVVAPGGAASLSGISRVDPKVLVARGLDAAGNEIVAGCAPVGEVTGAASVTINTEAVAVPTIDQRRADLPLGSDQPPVVVHVLDALGAPLGDRRVVWRVYGPKGLPGGATHAPGCPIADVDGCLLTPAIGDAAFSPAPPAPPGPDLVSVRVEWARTQPPPVAAFGSPRAQSFALRVPGQPASCAAYRAAAGVRIACLATPLGGGTEVRHFAWDGSAIAKLAGSPSVPNAFALVAAPGGATDTLIAITTGGDFVDGLTGQTLGHATFPATPTDAQLVPACGAQAFVVVGFAGGTVQSYTTTGADLATFVASPQGRKFTLAASGCVSDVAAPTTTYRAVVMTETNAMGATVPYARVDCPGAPCEPSWFGVGGVGFVAGGTDDVRLAAGELDLSGVVISEFLLDPAAKDPSQELVAPRTYASISVPESIVGGDFDGDGKPDRAWLLAGGGGNSTGRLEVQLAATTSDGTQIAGLSQQIAVAPIGVVVAKLDDDQTDDVAIYSAGFLTIALTGKAP